MSQMLARRREFIKSISPGLDEATVNEKGLREFDQRWSSIGQRFAMIPGKDALANLNDALQSQFGINVSPTAIIDSMSEEDVPQEMRMILDEIAKFSDVTVRN